MIVDKVNLYLSQKDLQVDESLRYEIEKMAGVSFKRQFMSKDEPVTKGKLRLSACGKCPRQNAYKFHGVEPKGKELDGRARMIFFQGDMVECALIGLIRLSGVPLLATGLQQDEIKFQINGATITGHPDGYFWHEDELYLLEVKSMSSYSFERFEKGDISEDYIAQTNAYMNKRKSVRKCCLVAMNKDNGILAEKIIERDEGVVSDVRNNLLSVLHSTLEKLPPPPPKYGPNEKGFYDWRCLYCSHWGHCRTNAERVLIKNSYKLKEKTSCSAGAEDLNHATGTATKKPRNQKKELENTQATQKPLS